MRGDFCRRWSRKPSGRDLTTMPGLAASLGDWIDWYGECPCDGCARVFYELLATTDRLAVASDQIRLDLGTVVHPSTGSPT